MQDYVVKNKDVFVGLEDSKKTWRVCVRCDGMIVHETSMPTEYDGLLRYLQRRFPGCRIRLMYEAGFNGFWLHDLLEGDGIGCEVIPPTKVTVEKCSRVKTDPRDARRLAAILEQGGHASCYVPDQERREDRQVSRTYEQMQRGVTATKNRIRKFFDVHGLNGLVGTKWWTASHLKEVRSCRLSASLRFALDQLLNHLEELLVRRRELKTYLCELSKKERYSATVSRFASAPGIGWFTGIRLVLEWGEELGRFANGKLFASFTGLTSSEYSTGKTVRRGRITCQSNPQVRATLIESAWTAKRKDPVLLEKYRAVLGRTGSPKKAIVAVARKLAVRLYHLAVKGENYQYGLIEEQLTPT